ncbi:MAG: succinate dehydrogenase/fumarate reductase iron-sulfur subunit [Candidatus Thermoplasmatota archaeon]|jgi:succinate dehydrogenase/fumarate reductase iron-sulfur protein|nr:succinate dehydrogenase/fumarate reductase iron-sulfur subunit [Candidatus Thermoplasmatota archaeon]MDP7265111.1 succinate dehydrogenase/fumarate reductase iron-sulfur subunit [Candidatus Thermoplasmatota archaeon]MEE1551583.1 succinate dehydrogenase/fumarate reductase iron-sulfur subunit [Nitrospinaceae bacterium]
MEIKFKVFRYNPERDERPYYKDFAIDMKKGSTILDAMHRIKEEKDGSFTFRRSCRSNICGSCAIKVNGQSLLACKTQISEASINGQILLEPLDNMRVIKDLVVDMEIFWDKIKGVRPWLSTGYEKELPSSEFRMEPAAIKELDATSNCIFCGVCFSACETMLINKRYMGPTAIAKCYRFVSDPRDNLGPKRVDTLIALTGESLWLCADCHNCEEFCPKKVKVREAGDHLRQIATERGFIHQGFKTQVEELVKRGRLLEISEFETAMREKYKLPPIPPTSQGSIALIKRTRILNKIEESQ